MSGCSAECREFVFWRERIHQCLKYAVFRGKQCQSRSGCSIFEGRFDFEREEGLFTDFSGLREGVFLVPVSPPVRFRGTKTAFFLNGRFLKNLGRLPLRRCVFLRFHFFWGARPPVHFGDLELTGTKKRLPLHEKYLVFFSSQRFCT